MTLAIHGGSPIRIRPFPPRPPYGIAERNAGNSVIASGQLSGYLADPGPNFLGGPKVRDLEWAFCEKFGVRYAVTMNSATSCLFGAVQALGIGPGDEVIVPTWSMRASADCVYAAGATPVFADIEPETYCFDYDSVVRRVTDQTKAIVLVDLFGCVPRDVDEIMCLGIPIIEDAAQAIGAYGPDPEFPAGTIGEIGVYSLNRHKTLQCGEGGVAVTNNDEIAERLRALRNHGDVVFPSGRRVVGQNYRLGETYAAVAEVQLGRLEELTEPRIRNAERLTIGLLELAELGGLTPPVGSEDLKHVYYLYAVRVPGSAARWAEVLAAEGVPASTYVQPLYRLPVFSGFAREGGYPATEAAYESVVVIPHVHAGMKDEDVDDVIAAFQKVHAHREDL